MDKVGDYYDDEDQEQVHADSDPAGAGYFGRIQIWGWTTAIYRRYIIYLI